MKKRGIDLSGYKSRWIGYELDDDFLAVVCLDEEITTFMAVVSPTANIILANENEGGILGPQNYQEEYERCCQLMEREVPKIADRIKKIASGQARP